MVHVHAKGLPGFASLAALAAGLVVLAAAPTAAGAEITIQIVEGGGAAWRFDPDELAIRVGDTVTWIYNYTTDTSHTVTSTDSLGEPLPNGLYDATLAAKGETFSFTFDEEGTFHFYCKPHASFMQGTVVVQASSAGSDPPPPPPEDPSPPPPDRPPGDDPEGGSDASGEADESQTTGDLGAGDAEPGGGDEQESPWVGPLGVVALLGLMAVVGRPRTRS